MPPKISDVEARVLEALRAANRQEKPNLAELSRQYNVPVKRLRNRHKGEDTAGMDSSPGWLGDASDKALVEDSANQIIARAWEGDAEDAPTVGSKWVDRFHQRTESLHRVKQKSVELARVAALEPKAIAKYFREFMEVRDKYGIQLGMMARKTLDEKTAAAEVREKRKANKRSLVSSVLESGNCRSQDWAKKQEFEAKQRKGEHLSNKREVYLRKEDGGWRQVLQGIKDIGRWGENAWAKRMGPYSRNEGWRVGDKVGFMYMEETVGYGKNVRATEREDVLYSDDMEGSVEENDEF
ncbi:hypothetical protein L198_07539 [Cryptococcus wingfieldii CBS 7118]|uniref:HTH CENPB-type domain-containing protein n=1 Tax=Cryptococcus wingfieldii CBS 7118 TaxID=1295528 RepID=A0A1E3IAG4_9TREE|nr:hypothetical protein L198_07539 [Cryptococcus wingfieldii CBS 7118]ODN85458.1 hypothetical protein L198_07539 [Cryptococcus wingfieldii CBS 7118]